MSLTIIIEEIYREINLDPRAIPQCTIPTNNDKENDKNFSSVASAGTGINLGSTGDLAAKAPGYRISPSGGPLLATQTGKNY